MMEIGIAALERESSDLTAGRVRGEAGGRLPRGLPPPAILLDTEFPEPDEYEVNIYSQDEFRLVAAVELVDPIEQGSSREPANLRQQV